MLAGQPGFWIYKKKLFCTFIIKEQCDAIFSYVQFSCCTYRYTYSASDDLESIEWTNVDYK